MKIDTTLFSSLPVSEQKSVIEALIFASSREENLTAANILDIVLNKKDNLGNVISKEYTLTLADIERYIVEINNSLEQTNRPFRITFYGGGYQFSTLPEYGRVVEQMLADKIKKRFTSAQLETLAIIAYRQPVTKQEVDRIRGVSSSSEIINLLIEKNLVEISGRKEILGRPLLYSTTVEFLRVFGLISLEDLPQLRELDEIAEQKLQEASDRTDLMIDISEEEVAEFKRYNLVEIVEDDKGDALDLSSSGINKTE